MTKRELELIEKLLLNWLHDINALQSHGNHAAANELRRAHRDMKQVLRKIL